MFSQKYHRYLFLFATALLVIGLPVSFFLLSAAQIILFVNWLLEGNFKNKLYSLKTRKAVLFVISIYFIHFLGLLNTNNFFSDLYSLRLLFSGSNSTEILTNLKEASLPSNFIYALHDLRIKLPLLILPLVYGTSEPFSKNEFKFIIHLFVVTVLVNSFITTFILLGFSNINLIDSRYASIFISHIRFSLLIVLSIFALCYLVFSNQFRLFKGEKAISLLIIVWLMFFLIFLKAFTGIVIFLILFPVGSVWCAYFRKKSGSIKMTFLINMFLATAVIFYILFSYFRYSQKHDENMEMLKEKTPNGNLYVHDVLSDKYENGYKIWINVCEEELAKEWNRRSRFAYDSIDSKGQPIRTTLIRYMTSLGYTKDSVGINKLNEEDIKMIEKGYTNCLYKNKIALYPRIYEFFWEIDRYRKSHDPSGQSLAQRIEYVKTGIHIIRDNFWFGTGTGDVQNTFQMQYIKDDSKLKLKYRYRTHNQFITFFLTFGIFGFLWILFALFYSPVLEKKYGNFMFLMFFLIGVLSMLNEDTLETHVGVSFFAFFYSFFLYAMPKEDDSLQKN
ncbi:MAG: O-antigen ligase family protein [Bacteroidales bacterium]|nr:O-antigen ligase family protein [Bacteroidales bacterium]